jgi:hypothetical protein
MELFAMFVVLLGIGLFIGFTLGYLATKTHRPDGALSIEEDLDRNLLNGSYQEVRLEATRLFDVLKSI